MYGIKTARIKELINVELPVIEVEESSTDFIFLLEDGTYLHFEFQTTYNKKDLARFAAYDIRLYERDGRSIITVIIYSSEVREADTDLHVGSLVYSPDKVMMVDYNGNTIYAELEAKIKARHELSDVDMLNLIFLPLMKNTTPKEELAVQTIRLAQSIPDTTKRNTCIAAAFAFTHKYMDKNKLDDLLEVLRMTDLATMLIDEKMIEVAKSMLIDKVSVEFISRHTGLDESIIKELQAELDGE